VQLKSQPRAVIADEVLAPRASTSGSASVQNKAAMNEDTQVNAVASGSSVPQDELARIRTLLRPSPIPGVADWGIPLASEEPCDPAIEVRRAIQIFLLPLCNSLDDVFGFSLLCYHCGSRPCLLILTLAPSSSPSFPLPYYLLS
jgi:hypothetical protein